MKFNLPRWICPNCNSSMEIGDELSLCKKCNVAWDKKTLYKVFQFGVRGDAKGVDDDLENRPASADR